MVRADMLEILRFEPARVDVIRFESQRDRWLCISRRSELGSRLPRNDFTVLDLTA
jgi:hypothetical protein